MNERHIKEEGLRDWFGKSSGTTKSGKKKKGWVQVGGKYDGKPCARQPGQKTTPKCVSSAKRRSMSKDERDSARRRKVAADPGQPQKRGAAAPTMVSTDPKKKMKEAMEVNEAKDKKGKGSGTKDACYHKVKSRYSVWPSAYASGALVKCRKVGAANWGNKSEGLSWDQLTEKCWPGYEKKGMKTMFGKRYPNCVKKKATRKEETEISEAPKPYQVGDTIPASATGQAGYQKRKMDVIKSTLKGNPKNWNFSQQNIDKKMMSTESLGIEEAVRLPAKTGNIVDAHFVFRGRSFMLKMFFPKVGIPSRSDVIDQINKVYPGAKLTFFRVADHEPGQPLLRVAEERAGDQAVEETTGSNSTTSGEISENAEGTLTEKSAAWTRKAGKNKEGGLNEKGRKSYERENPGSDLKAPSKKVGNKRRASFCARMKGMKKKLTSAKTANDPDSRINKSLRAWNC